MEDLPETLQVGKRYVIERERADGLREATVKQLASALQALLDRVFTIAVGQCDFGARFLREIKLLDSFAQSRVHALQTLAQCRKHIGFSQDDKLTSPCHLQTRKGKFVIPDLDASVSVLDENNKLVATLGRAPDAKAARALRTKDRTAFVPGQFVCPHGACFDHKGNIYVVEWVEVGRVTKLQKV